VGGGGGGGGGGRGGGGGGGGVSPPPPPPPSRADGRGISNYRMANKKAKIAILALCSLLAATAAGFVFPHTLPVMTIRGITGIDNVFVADADLRINGQHVRIRGLVYCVYPKYSAVPHEKQSYPDGFYKILRNGHEIDLITDGMCPTDKDDNTSAHPIIVDRFGDTAKVYLIDSQQISGSKATFRRVAIDNMIGEADSSLMYCMRGGMGGPQKNKYYIGQSVVPFNGDEHIENRILENASIKRNDIYFWREMREQGFFRIDEYNFLRGCRESGNDKTRCPEYVAYISRSSPILSIYDDGDGHINISTGDKGTAILRYPGDYSLYRSIIDYSGGQVGLQQFDFCYHNLKR
jgi:hypothetical protein